MDKQEAAGRIEDIAKEIADLTQELRQIAHATNSEYEKKYQIATLEILVEAGGWMSKDRTLYDWARDLLQEADADERAEKHAWEICEYHPGNPLDVYGACAACSAEMHADPEAYIAKHEGQ